ncbi:Rieske 2Fe-2S domain-containing protein [Actinosynnema sp. NPDC020468]|uniref:Rieske (2Fe-2S) protein n=1 Tax=Actinosynnema sp. NPDC020468 TaxID=3154488 RepID=UPI0033E65600
MTAVEPRPAGVPAGEPAGEPAPRKRTGVVMRQLTADLVLVEAGGQRFLTEAECPHRKGRMLFGIVNERRLRITCPLHHSTFDLNTGEQVSGPECGSLRVTRLPADGPYPL